MVLKVAIIPGAVTREGKSDSACYAIVNIRLSTRPECCRGVYDGIKCTPVARCVAGSTSIRIVGGYMVPRRTRSLSGYACICGVSPEVIVLDTIPIPWRPRWSKECRRTERRIRIPIARAWGTWETAARRCRGEISIISPLVDASHPCFLSGSRSDATRICHRPCQEGCRCTCITRCPYLYETSRPYDYIGSIASGHFRAR